MVGPTPRSTSRVRFLAVLFAGTLWLGCSDDDLTQPEDPQTLPQAIEIQERHTEVLMAIEGVVGTAVGFSANDAPEIRVYTMEPGIEGLPELLEGYPVVIKPTGMLMALSDPTAKQPRPVPIGVSTGHPAITAGTIAARVKDALGNVYALSNNHVYAASNDAELDDNVLQPGVFDGAADPTDAIGILDSFVPIDFSGGANIVDAAIAMSSRAMLHNSTPSDDGYGIPSSTTVAAFVGQPVKKYGRTTKLTHGEVTEVNVTANVCYEVAVLICTKTARFTGQIGISTTGFSDGGDSGSLIVTENGNNPVGLLFAGSATLTLANPIDAVLDAFGVVIDDTLAPPPTPLTDIAVTNVVAPTSAAQGDTVRIDVTVSNVGNQDVTSSIDVTLIDDTDTLDIGTQTIAGGLAAGTSTTLTYTWITAVASLGGHTLTASQSFADDNGGNDSSGATVEIEEVLPPATGMHMGDLFPYASNEGSTWSGYVIVGVHDSNHNPIEGVTVYGSWTGGGLAVDECDTDYAGECLMLSTLLPTSVASVTFTVTDVVGALAYNAGDNHDDDGDSDGTSITITRLDQTDVQ
jgi:hypothetical protein